MRSPIGAFATQVKWEQKSFWRNPAAAAFTFAFPLMFLVVFIAINGNERLRQSGGSVKFSQYYVPAILAFGLISACYTNLAFAVSNRRENGMLKRTRGTPLSPVTYLAGMIGNVLVVAMILSALVIALGLLAYGISFPGRYLGLAVTVVVGAFCFSALGVAVSTFVPNEDAAPAIINFVLFPLLFISGTFGQVKETSMIGRIASVFPVSSMNRSMVAVFDPFESGSGIHLKYIAILVAWGLVGIAISLRRFRWEPRR